MATEAGFINGEMSCAPAGLGVVMVICLRIRSGIDVDHHAPTNGAREQAWGRLERAGKRDFLRDGVQLTPVDFFGEASPGAQASFTRRHDRVDARKRDTAKDEWRHGC